MTRGGEVPPRKPDSTPDDPTSPAALAESFIQVNKQIRRDSSRGGELSNARFEMLHAVFHGGAKPMKAIAEVLGVTARSVTDMADALVAEGYLARTPDPADRRVVLLALTDSGTLALVTERRKRIAEAAVRFERLSPTQRAQLAGILDALRD
jgi:DNA-binding MarR family transcriptional regulator